MAQHEASKDTVEAAQARLRVSQIKLRYTKIHSSIDGVIGKTKVKVSDFDGRGPQPVLLNVVSNTDPIHVEFSLAENPYLELAGRYTIAMEYKVLFEYEDAVLDAFREVEDALVAAETYRREMEAVSNKLVDAQNANDFSYVNLYEAFGGGWISREELELEVAAVDREAAIV